MGVGSHVALSHHGGGVTCSAESPWGWGHNGY